MISQTEKESIILQNRVRMTITSLAATIVVHE
jgi:hypothetical protein